MKAKLIEALAGRPRVALMDGETPVRRLGTVGDDVNLWIKQDDQGSIGGGGSKLRKLEFIAGEALAAEADILVTGGAIQSNHARLTAATAAFLGIGSETFLLNLAGVDGQTYGRSGNRLLNSVFGSDVHLLDPDADLAEALERRATALRANGHRPFVVPFGGSSPTGCLGSLAGALELAEQWGARRPPSAVYVACGSGGMHAGMTVGLSALWPGTTVIGISILETREACTARVIGLASSVIEVLGIAGLTTGDVHVDDTRIGSGYGALTADGVAAIRKTGARYGIALDPVYTAKAMAGLLSHVGEGRYGPGDDVLFIHSGGLPGVFAYGDRLAAALGQTHDMALEV